MSTSFFCQTVSTFCLILAVHYALSQPSSLPLDKSISRLVSCLLCKIDRSSLRFRSSNMVSASSLSLLLVAGTALAAPSNWSLHKRCGEPVSFGGFGSGPNCWGACASDPACTGGKPAAQAQAPAPATPAPAPAQPATNNNAAQSNSGSSGGNAYVDAVNNYRQMMGKNLPTLSYSSTLEGNVQKTLNDHKGQMVHELNPGTGGQVLAQGDCGDFVTALVHGWICEIPSLLPSGKCNGGNYNLGGQTGHAEILSSGSYSKVACACTSGIWGCDFGS